MTETWRPVPGYEGLYEVSDLGRVRSLDRVVTRSGGGTVTCRGVTLALSTRRDGRRKVQLHRDGAGTTRLVAHLVLEAFTGPRPAGLEACHNDDDPANDRASNLRWDTHPSNCEDRTRLGGHGNLKKACCPRGHLLRPPNIRAQDLRRGHRNCLACHRADSRVRWAAGKGMVLDFREVADDYYARIMGAAA
jgi:hypothetical protein